MDEKAGMRKKLEKAMGKRLPQYVWDDRTVQSTADDCLNTGGNEYHEYWEALVEAVQDRLLIVEASKAEALGGVQSGTPNGSQDMQKAQERDLRAGGQGLDTRELFSDRSKAMTGAMSELFWLLGHQFPNVKDFRERVLPKRSLTADEAHSLIGSYAARTLPFGYFANWDIPVVGHSVEVLDSASQRGEFSPIDDWMTLQIDPPGITKTVRYARPREGDVHTWHAHRNEATIPVYTDFFIEEHGGHTYPMWLWPGSVVDELFELSTELANAFDWPRGVREGNLSNTRPLSETACWFILTGEAPQVWPLNARWTMQGGSTYLNPQWRIQLTIPPWLPEEEMLQAFRALRRQRSKGHQMPKSAIPLEVARFVWERERLDGYRKPAPWTAWQKQWNEEHPGHRFKTASHFRTYFLRGDEAVKRLNFDIPEFNFGESEIE